MIWVYTICSDLSVQKLRIITVSIHHGCTQSPRQSHYEYVVQQSDVSWRLDPYNRTGIVDDIIKWARSCENVSYAICEQQRCSTFIVRCLDSMVCILALPKVSRFYLVSVAEQAGLNLTWLKIPEDTFSRGEVQIISMELPSKRKTFKLSEIKKKIFRFYSLILRRVNC